MPISLIAFLATATLFGDGSQFLFPSNDTLITHITESDDPSTTYETLNSIVRGYESTPILLNASGIFQSSPEHAFYRWDINQDGVWESEWQDTPEFEYTWFDDHSGATNVALGETEESEDVAVKSGAQGWSGLGADSWWAQSFIPTKPLITKIAVDVSINWGDPAPLNVWIRDSLDWGGNNLTWGSVPSSQVPRGRVIPVSDWPIIDLEDAELVVGKTYYLIANMTKLEQDTGVYEGHGTDDVYPGGNLHTGNPFKGWYSDTTSDFRFRTLTSEIRTLGVGNISVFIENLAPSIEKFEISRSFWAKPTFTIAGEKWHDVDVYLRLEDDIIAHGSLLRQPGSPRLMSVEITNESVNLFENYSVLIVYTPMDDPINGQVWGSTPAWLDLISEDGSVVRLHHTFNVRHPHTWEWRLDSFSDILGGTRIEFEVSVVDFGTDDLTFTWDWGDGTSTTTKHYYDPSRVPPDDPISSPYEPYTGGMTPPLSVEVAQVHMYDSPGTYLVNLTVTDDDGGVVTAALVVS